MIIRIRIEQTMIVKGFNVVDELSPDSLESLELHLLFKHVPLIHSEPTSQ